jgi:hypothetical protein
MQRLGTETAPTKTEVKQTNAAYLRSRTAAKRPLAELQILCAALVCR